MQLRVKLAVLAITLGAQPALAQSRADSAAFIVRLGVDTTSIERYVRTSDRITIEAVQRSPTTSVHRLQLTLGPQGQVTGGTYALSRPGANTPVAQRTFEFQGDSATITVIEGANRRPQRVAARDAIPIIGPFYTPYELAMMRGVARNAARSEVALLAGGGTVAIPIERVGRDSVRLTNQFAEPMRAHVDAQGRLLHLSTPAFTTVERLRWIDLERMTAEFARRDETGRALGPLSPRFAARTRIGGANLWLDYGRPAMRGRPVWGALVPFGAVWRLGANDAAHFATDRALEFADVTLQPGTYTLFLLPTANQWQLIINRGTGMSGLDYDEALDLTRVAMTKETLERPVEQFTIQLEEAQGGGRLVILWDRTRAFVPFRVR